MCQLEHNFLCRFCPFEEKCEEERRNLTEDERKKIKEIENSASRRPRIVISF